MLLPRVVLAGAFLATGLGAGAGVAAAEPAATDVVVEFADDATAAQRADALEAMDATLVETVGENFAVVEVAGPAGGAGAVAPGAVVDVDPVAPVTAFATPNDPLFPAQWHLRAVQAEAAWDVATGAGVVVAVIDSGVAAGAPDLAGVSFVAGRDWVDGGAPEDLNGHGTHVTGTIAQRTGNGIGGAGLAHGATIMPLRVLDAEGRGRDVDVAAAVDHAVAAGADVINLSLGGPTPTSVLQAAVNQALAAGVVVVAATGNTGTVGVAYPAAFPGVLAVAAVGTSLERASYSAYGPEVDLAAPGSGVIQQTLGSPWCYCSYSGTSMATPHVSAAAALLLSNGVASSQVASRLLATAKDVGSPGRDDATGVGLVQAAAALASTAAAPATAPAPSPTSAPAPTTTESAPVSGPSPEAPFPEEGDAPAAVQDLEDACPVGSVPRQRFADVDASSVHGRAIDCAAWLRLASGVDATSFAPAVAVTRAQMATFLARLLERAGVALPAAPPNAFDDDAGSPHEGAVDRLAAAGVLRGTGPRTFAPGAPVSRAAMATFLVAVHDLIAAADLPAGGDRFADDDGNVHEPAIGRLAAAGIATGTGSSTFAPGAVVVRGQLATFLARVFDAVIDAGDVAAP